MKHIHIQDVPRRKLEDVVLDIVGALDTCRWAFQDVAEASEHGFISEDELRQKVGDIGYSFFDGVFNIFVKAGWLVKHEEAENE